MNGKQIALQGHSRLGKAALWASALDDRIKVVYASCSGEMGAALSRRDWGETVDDMAQNFPWWFAGNFQKYAGRWNDMPVDAHMLIALSAPRPVFITGGTTDQWADPVGMFLAEMNAGPVYKLLGRTDLGVIQGPPPLDTPVTKGDLGWHYHTGGHAATPADWTAFLDFAGKYPQVNRQSGLGTRESGLGGIRVSGSGREGTGLGARGDSGSGDSGFGIRDGSEPGTRKPEPEPEPGTRNPEPGPGTRNPEPGTRNRGTRKPEPESRNPEPGTRNPEPGTPNPEPGTRNQLSASHHEHRVRPHQDHHRGGGEPQCDGRWSRRCDLRRQSPMPQEDRSCANDRQHQGLDDAADHDHRDGRLHGEEPGDRQQPENHDEPIAHRDARRQIVDVEAAGKPAHIGEEARVRGRGRETTGADPLQRRKELGRRLFDRAGHERVRIGRCGGAGGLTSVLMAREYAPFCHVCRQLAP